MRVLPVLGLVFALALVVGCTKSEPIGAASPEPEPTAVEPTPVRAPAPAEPSAHANDPTAAALAAATAAAGGQTRIEPDRSCQVDSDCAAARAFAGLDYIPSDPTTAMCGDLCFVAMSKAAVRSWDAKRTASEEMVPCDKKFGKCGLPSDVKVACVSNRCQITE
ncbi:hypothetical protein [Haliangium sp.]|uniref:hypothetical protein n=1 Tax=Haliangium sp. TaxID=2663208 RepID=UPI003D0DD9BD